MHKDLLRQLAIKKDILDIKLRDRPIANISQKEEWEHLSCGPLEQMSSTNRSRNDAWTKNHVPRDAAVALKRNIGVSLNFVDSLEGDGTNTRGAS